MFTITLGALLFNYSMCFYSPYAPVCLRCVTDFLPAGVRLLPVNSTLPVFAVSSSTVNKLLSCHVANILFMLFSALNLAYVRTQMT